MENIRRLLGRLYPGPNRLSGSANLTQQDIAAALAMVRSKLAREVLCACWWQPGAELTRPQLLEMIAVKQYQEIIQQRSHVEEVIMSTLVAVDTAIDAGRNPEEDESIRSLNAKLAKARSGLWFSRMQVPLDDFAMLSKIRVAALTEISRPAMCPDCQGHMYRQIDTKFVKCLRCKGVGTVPVSNRDRADLIERDESNYRRQWKPIYQYTYKIVRQAEAHAVHRMIEVTEDVCRGRLFRRGEYVPLAQQGLRH